MVTILAKYRSTSLSQSPREWRLEDLKVLRRSPDLFNNVKIGQGQLQLIMKHILFYQPFWSSDLSNLMKNPSVISVKKMLRYRYVAVQMSGLG